MVSRVRSRGLRYVSGGQGTSPRPELRYVSGGGQPESAAPVDKIARSVTSGSLRIGIRPRGGLRTVRGASPRR